MKRIAVVLLAFGCQEGEKPEMLMHEQSVLMHEQSQNVDGGSMAFRRVVRGNVPVRQSHGVDVEAFGEAPPEIEFTRDDVMEFDATEEVPDALAELREETAPKPVAGMITSGQSLLGRTITLGAGQRGEILALRAPSEELSSTFTVYVSQVGKRQTPSGHPIEMDLYDVETPFAEGAVVYALIEWGVGGVQHRTLVDVVPGQAITVAGSFVRITGINNLSATEIQINAMISLLPRSSRKSPQVTTQLPPMPANAGVYVNGLGIPPFTRGFKVFRSPHTAPFSIRIMDEAGGSIAEYVVAASETPPEIDLPGNAFAIAIATGVVAIPSIGIIFYLGL